MLFDYSDEFGRHDGLGVLRGHVRRIAPSASAEVTPKVPHIGWAELVRPVEANDDRWRGTPLDGIGATDSVYFVHSYTAVPANPAHRLADTYYFGDRISAAVQRDVLFGTQFHPEKSGPVGLDVLRRFAQA